MDDLNELKDLKELEDYMKNGYPSCWTRVKNYNDVQREIAELCLKYKYRVVSILDNPETLGKKILFEKLGGVKDDD